MELFQFLDEVRRINKMTMAEFKKELIKTIPTPETIYQKLLLEATEEINGKLMVQGEVRIIRGTKDGNRVMFIKIAHALEKMYKDMGYEVYLCEYAETNRNNYFWIDVKYGG